MVPVCLELSFAVVRSDLILKKPSRYDDDDDDTDHGFLWWILWMPIIFPNRHSTYKLYLQLVNSMLHYYVQYDDILKSVTNVQFIQSILRLKDVIKKISLKNLIFERALFISFLLLFAHTSFLRGGRDFLPPTMAFRSCV